VIDDVRQAADDDSARDAAIGGGQDALAIHA
jgi:hypothetical protein